MSHMGKNDWHIVVTVVAIPNPTFFLFLCFLDKVDLYIKENEKDILTYSQCLHFPICDMVYIFHCMILIFTKVIFRDMLITDFTVHDQIYFSHFDYRYCNMNVDELKRSIFFISFSYYLFF